MVSKYSTLKYFVDLAKRMTKHIENWAKKSPKDYRNDVIKCAKNSLTFIPETCGYLPSPFSIPENPCSKALIRYFPLISMISAVFPKGLIVFRSSRVMFSVERKVEGSLKKSISTKCCNFWFSGISVRVLSTCWGTNRGTYWLSNSVLLAYKIKFFI